MKKEIVLELIGAISGAIIINFLEHFKVFDFLNLPVPFGMLVLIVFLFIIAVVMMRSYCKMKFHQNKKIFIISSAFTTAPFFSELVKDIINEIEAQGFEPVLKLPHEDFNSNDLTKHIDKLFSEIDNYSGGIFIHAEPDKNYDRLKRFSEKFGKPLIFLDCHKTDLYKSFNESCAFIGYDNSVIGKIAGESAASILEHRHINTPKILVIASKLQSERQNNFITTVKSKFSNSEIILDDGGDFNRKKAHRILSENLKLKIKNNEKIWDLIFCTNDEMALGSIAAIREINNKAVNTIALIGCDGIEEAKAFIDKKGKHFINTVDQDPKHLSKVGVECLFKKLRGEITSKENYLTPTMYIPIY